jgi:myo-inositol-1(or 4)-monophosphatase
MHGFKKAVIDANLEILELVKTKSHDKLCEKVSIGYGGDMSIQIDLLAEEIFVNHLSKYGNIYSEECGYINNKSEFDIVIDPIDGSSNFASNLPYFGTSVALKKNDTHVCSVIANLANQDIFIKDDKCLVSGKLIDLIFKETDVNTNSSVGIFERAYCSKNIFEKLKSLKIKYRSPGAIALSLAYARDVDFVLYEGALRAFDIEAGLHICEDLNLYQNSKILFISKDKEIFDKITKLF